MTTSSFAPPPRRRIVAPAWTKTFVATTPTPDPEPVREGRRSGRKASRSSFDLPPLPGGDELFISHPDVLLGMFGEDAGFEVPRGAPAPHDVIREEDEASEFAASNPITESRAEREDVENARESDAATDGPADVALRPPPDVADLFGEHLWRAYGRAPTHERVYGSVPKNWGDNVTLSAGLTSDGLIAPLRLIGAMNSDILGRADEQIDRSGPRRGSTGSRQHDLRFEWRPRA